MSIDSKVPEKPSDWPANYREQDLEIIGRAVERFDKNPSYRTREVLISLISDFDLNQTGALGLCRVTEYEVAKINELFTWGLTHYCPALRCYLYSLVGQTTRSQKMEAYMMQSVGKDENIGIPAYENGLLLSLRLYHFAYQKFNVEKDKSFADSFIEIINDVRKGFKEEQISDGALFRLSQSLTIMLNDLSYSRGNKKEAIWKFDRTDLRKLFVLEAELIKDTNQNPCVRPLRGVLMTQISNFILKSRNNYNEDFICKYISEKTASNSTYNHEIWMNKVENLNDEREGHVLEEVFKDRSWIEVDWVKKLVFTPSRRYFVSSFSKSIDNPDTKREYGSVMVGYKGDRIADLISPMYKVHMERNIPDESIPDEIKMTVFSLVTAFDVLYNVDELKEELNFLINTIDLFSISSDEKNEFLNTILQYWLLSAKDPKWACERERRYVLFLYDKYDYQEMVVEDGFLKLKSSLFVLPDFVLGNHPRKEVLRRMVDDKRESTAYMRYLFCHNCLSRDFDVVAGYSKPKCCPVCGSVNFEVVDPRETADEVTD